MEINAKMLELGKRVYNNKMLETKDQEGKIVLSDDGAIKALCEKVFTKNGEVRSMEELRSFNRLIVEVAEEEAKANFKQVMDLISQYETVGRYDQRSYEIPSKQKVSMRLSATGTGVDFVKIPSKQKRIPARPEQHQFGCQYSIERMINDPVNAFRDAVDLIVEEKVKYIFKQVMKLVRLAASSGKIPAGQCHATANITLTDFRKIESKLLRYARNVRPVLIADRLFIDDIALKQGVTLENGISFLTDAMRETLLRDINIDVVSKTVCIATDNPFVDDANSKVELPVDEAIIVAGGSKAPFRITEFGAMRTAQDMPSIENETTYFKVDLKISIELLLGQALGYIKDTQIKL